jgi:hypothetical protein
MMLALTAIAALGGAARTAAGVIKKEAHRLEMHRVSCSRTAAQGTLRLRVVSSSSRAGGGNVCVRRVANDVGDESPAVT